MPRSHTFPLSFGGVASVHDSGFSSTGRPPDLSSTALVLVGFQNDFFAPGGALRPSLEDPERLGGALEATVALVRRLTSTAATMVAVPIGFTETYEELVDPAGILASIKAVSAFRKGTVGAEMVDGLRPFLGRLKVTPAGRGFDGFAGTDLDSALGAAGIENVVVAGALDSVCIDSTARAAFQRGYRVTVLCDCTFGRTAFEHDFFCESIFPMYAEVTASVTLLDRVGAAEPAM